MFEAGRVADQIVPVDSEHSALAQCLRGGTAAEVRRLVLNPFARKAIDALERGRGLEIG